MLSLWVCDVCGIEVFWWVVVWWDFGSFWDGVLVGACFLVKLLWLSFYIGE